MDDLRQIPRPDLCSDESELEDAVENNPGGRGQEGNSENSDDNVGDTATGSEFAEYDDFDDFDEDNIIWRHGSGEAFEASGYVEDWAVTSTVTSTDFDYERLCLFHTMAGEWPEVLGIFPEDPEAPMEGNIWIIARVEGTWYAATFDYLRPGGECKYEDWSPTGEGPGPSTFGAESLSTWVPRTGEPVYMFMSTVARHGPLGPLHERSNYVQMIWP